jgi:hypothetical protein
MNPNIFSQDTFQFPYHYKFPGQASDEVILFVTRENPVMLTVQRAGVVATAAVLVLTGWWLADISRSVIGGLYANMMQTGILVLAGGFLLLGWWWTTTLWQKSIFVLTTKRLTKFIYTTPFNRHSLSLPLEMIVDTGAYTKGFLQALFRLGTFTARSSAASSGVATEEEDYGPGRRINKKYFYLENIAIAEDLQHYVTKLLSALRKYPEEQMATFRPFIPSLKGEARKKFMEQYPEYWS